MWTAYHHRNITGRASICIPCWQVGSKLCHQLILPNLVVCFTESHITFQLCHGYYINFLKWFITFSYQHASRVPNTCPRLLINLEKVGEVCCLCSIGGHCVCVWCGACQLSFKQTGKEIIFSWHMQPEMLSHLRRQHLKVWGKMPLQVVKHLIGVSWVKNCSTGSLPPILKASVTSSVLAVTCSCMIRLYVDVCTTDPNDLPCLLG